MKESIMYLILVVYALLTLLILVRFTMEFRRIDKEYEEKLKEIYKYRVHK